MIHYYDLLISGRLDRKRYTIDGGAIDLDVFAHRVAAIWFCRDAILGCIR